MPPILVQAAVPSLVLSGGDAPTPSGTSALPQVDYAKADDRELASLASQGREAAFRELLSRYERPVFSLVYRMVRDRTLAEDLAQEAIARAIAATRPPDHPAAFRAWVFRILRNRCLDYLKDRRRNTVGIDDESILWNFEKGAIVKKEYDTNFDSNIDLWRFFDKGTPRSRASSSSCPRPGT